MLELDYSSVIAKELLTAQLGFCGFMFLTICMAIGLRWLYKNSKESNLLDKFESTTMFGLLSLLLVIFFVSGLGFIPSMKYPEAAVVERLLQAK